MTAAQASSGTLVDAAACLGRTGPAGLGEPALRGLGEALLPAGEAIECCGRAVAMPALTAGARAQALSNGKIASRLWISAGPVKTHFEHIYAKLGVHSRRELMQRRDEIAGWTTPASAGGC